MYASDVASTSQTSDIDCVKTSIDKESDRVVNSSRRHYSHAVAMSTLLFISLVLLLPHAHCLHIRDAFSNPAQRHENFQKLVSIGNLYNEAFKCKIVGNRQSGHWPPLFGRHQQCVRARARSDAETSRIDRPREISRARPQC